MKHSVADLLAEKRGINLGTKTLLDTVHLSQRLG